MTKIAAAEAKNRFAELIDRANAGEEIEVTKYGHVVARIVAPKQGRDVAKALAALERLRANAKEIGIKFDWAEWKAYRDEGRR
ncbi:MAG: type II toxin-antitoxin system prevent-host-death family antitoxin [Alphaproteobacteria bacterium]|nr:type II toxin-antitoxin system prevent-host-death family antitoxin [Alphaproteobacteria bacterium]